MRSAHSFCLNAIGLAFPLAFCASAQITQIDGDFSRNGSVGPEDLVQLIEGFGEQVAVSSGGALLWANKAGSMSFDGAEDVAVFPGGDILVAGSVSPGAVFAPGEPEQTSVPGSGTFIAILARYAADGTFQWFRDTQGSGTQEIANGVAVAGSDQTARVTGQFTGTAVFGAGETGETPLVSADNADVYVSSYNSDGSLVWARRAGGTEFQEGLQVAVGADGSSVAVGVFDATATFGEGGGAVSLEEIGNGRTVFMAKYDSTGNFQWAQGIARGTFSSSLDVALLSDGSPIVGGVFRGQATLGMGQPNETTIDSGDTSGDGFLARFDGNGGFQWVATIDSPSDDAVNSLAVTQGQTILATGSFSETAVFGSAKGPAPSLVSVDATDMFIAAYSDSGEVQWARRVGSLGTDSGSSISAFPDGSFVLGGTFREDTVLGPAELFETTFVSLGEIDSFVARFGSDGALQWARHLGGPANVIVTGVAAATDGTSTAVGSFARTANFGVGGDDAVELTETRDFGSVTDIFIARFGQ